MKKTFWNGLAPWLVLVMCVVLSACGEAELTQSGGNDAGQSDAGQSDTGQHKADGADADGQGDASTEIVSCVETCEWLKACGTLSTADDAQSCDVLCSLSEIEFEPAVPAMFSETCQQCMGNVCDQVSACLSDSTVCGPPISAGVTFLINGLAAPEGTVARANLLYPDGSVASTGASGRVGSNEAVMFRFRDVVHAGVAYRLVYFVDVEGDGKCSESNDITGEIYHVTSRSTTFESDTYTWEGQASDVCASFRTETELCVDRCASEQVCGLNEESEADCLAECTFTDLAVTELCSACMDKRSCSEQEATCFGEDNPCDLLYEIPTGAFIGMLQGFEDAAGVPVHGVLFDEDNTVVARAHQVVLIKENGEIGLNFGINLRGGRVYYAAVFLDHDRDGTCSAGDQAYRWDEPPITATHNSLHVNHLELEKATLVDCF